MGLLPFLRSLSSTLHKLKNTPVFTLLNIALSQNFAFEVAGSSYHVVLGNEACDLDSAVTALSYAYLLQSQQPNTQVVPVLNVPKSQFHTKTEVLFTLDRILEGFQPSKDLVFIDDVDLAQLSAENRLILTLVDHHFLAPSQSGLRKSVVEVVDHHQRHEESLAGLNPAKVRVETVGSGASLVAEKFKEAGIPPDSSIALLLRSAIVLDTVNLSPEARRAKELDSLMLDWLEEGLRRNLTSFTDRKVLLQELESARSDISGLSLPEVLEKDSKFIRGVKNLAVPTVPVLLPTFMSYLERRRPGVTLAEALTEYNRNSSLDATVVLFSQDGRRQLLIHSEDPDLSSRIQASLTHPRQGFFLGLTTLPLPGLTAFDQGDPTITRKKILPALADVFA